MINELKFQVFCSLAETLSFTVTSKNMFLSQQTVSRLISELEDEVGIRLFDRSSRYVKLTKAGRRYHKVVVEMLWMHENILSELNKDYGGKGLMIDVQLNLDIGPCARDAMRMTRERFPQFYSYSARISPNFLIERLLCGKSDVAIMLDRFLAPDERMCVQPLFDTDYLLVTADATLPDAPGEAVKRLGCGVLLYDALDMEPPTSCALRCKKETSLLGLTPGEIKWMPNADSAYARAELNEGGIIIATAADRVGRGRNLMGYPTGKTCKVVAVSRAGETDNLIKSYIEFLASSFNENSDVYQPITKPIQFF